MSHDEPIILTLASESDTDRLGRVIAEVVQPNQVIGLVGPLGAGKTRLSRAIAEASGVAPEVISSPTFVLINEYIGNRPVYHFDAYRLADADDFDALGAPEYFEAGGICLVEWADLVLDRLPTDAWLITIEPAGAATRKITVEGSNLDPLRDAIRTTLGG